MRERMTQRKRELHPHIRRRQHQIRRGPLRTRPPRQARPPDVLLLRHHIPRGVPPRQEQPIVRLVGGRVVLIPKPPVIP